MAIKKIDSTQWKAYFDAFSKKLFQDHRVDYAEIRVFSPEMGAQVETEWLPLAGITYDNRDDLLEVAVKNLDHLIYQPVEIYVDEEEGVLSSMEIVRKDGIKEVIELR